MFARPKSQDLRPEHVEFLLRDLDFPARKRDVVTWARGEDAPDEVIKRLRQLPNREYHNAHEVSVRYATVA